MGDRFDTFFWTDPWLGGTPLSVRFGRLFDLEVHESSTVVTISTLEWEAVGASGGTRGLLRVNSTTPEK
jgi:hypothetical protein